MPETTDWGRMWGWLAAGLLLYLVAPYIPSDWPNLQVLCRKAGNVTIFGWFGYWVARGALGRLRQDDPNEHPLQYVARAVLMGCVILAGGMGL